MFVNARSIIYYVFKERRIELPRNNYNNKKVTVLTTKYCILHKNNYYLKYFTNEVKILTRINLFKNPVLHLYLTNRVSKVMFFLQLCGCKVLQSQFILLRK